MLRFERHLVHVAKHAATRGPCDPHTGRVHGAERRAGEPLRGEPIDDERRDVKAEII
jgi:hypothetical protein